MRLHVTQDSRSREKIAQTWPFRVREGRKGAFLLISWFVCFPNTETSMQKLSDFVKFISFLFVELIHLLCHCIIFFLLNVNFLQIQFCSALLSHSFSCRVLIQTKCGKFVYPNSNVCTCLQRQYFLTFFVRI
jgi:hypothetical protein